MGKKSGTPSGLAKALFSRVQLRVLAILFGHPDRSFNASEIIKLAASGSGAVQRELQRLADVKILNVEMSGNRKLYSVNRESPVFEELQSLVRKTVGLVEPIRAALTRFADRIDAAFVYGSVAKATDTATSDIDLMIITDDVTYGEIFKALQDAEAVLHRPINPSVMTLQDWRRRHDEQNSFVTRIISQPHLFVMGDAHAIA
ncbi:nucleotidyltransferase domain-containing protein [Pseudorhodoplanes sinuspersici]|uniref:Uncharacterized protein n=1 Tax=Pseudorhodoplanes sinuspersici TaxID=1235591 RepID=A0A1W6ZU13_9HYPH|nr:nucleotidyltransferase domain-containing protein [Pseudorhodoplanes sinuspersici]ARQ00897.1 hypothetical protein CAK95_18720 [Pseudorhodoplanes sinuspersici]RKE72521.1 nucleotidyltransferase-like protein [Pseudorhodoplanes sinuspersici]